MKKHIPNLLTCCNLFCGCLGVNFAYNGNLTWAAYMIGLAGVFDFFDGFVARLLNVSSPIGKELDSLADMVSFGFLPGIIMFHLLKPTADLSAYLPFVAFIIPIFSALRLAQFNVDTRQSDSFIGVPTPANAILIGSLPLIAEFHPQFSEWVSNPYILLPVTVIMSLLLVAELPLIALKFKDYSFGNNKIKYTFLLLTVLLIAFFKFAGVPLVIIAYILLSVLENMTKKTN